MDDLISRQTDCVLSEFGNCSYSETGCADCEVKANIRIALSAYWKCKRMYTDVSDTISRRAAIDDMKDALDPHIVQFVKAKMAIEALPSVQPEPHWIPCSDRLPEEQRYCLTSCRNGLVCEDFHWNNGYFDKADKYHHEVIAWMPLPEPYRGGDSNE